MHELSVCQGLLDQVTGIARQHQATGVARIRLRIGPLSGVEPQLLQQAFPQGPESVISTQRVQVDESDAPVGTETTNTSRYFYPPWKLRGDVRRVAADRIGFDFQFVAASAGAPARSEKYALSGIWQQRTPTPRFADDFSLLGWSVYRIRMGTRDAGGITIAAYVTTADSRHYQTLGELRGALPTGRN